MMTRHRGIDARLAEAIESGEVSQVIETAAGLSPRGWRFRRRYGDRICYIETDLPQMAATKRDLLARGHFPSERHRVAALDALTDVYPQGRKSKAGWCSTSRLRRT